MLYYEQPTLNTSKRQFLIIGIVSLGILGSLLISWLCGYRFFTVVSPSMGETAPVGSLVVARAADSYTPQDIITFYRGGKIYTHRVQALDKDGFITKGDLNQSNDPLPVAKHDIIGKTVFIGKYLGWIWQGLPMLLAGWLIVYLLSIMKRVRDNWRWPIRLIGGSIVVIITTFILNPWLHVDLLSYTAHEKGGVNLNVVNTGVFPIRDDKGGRFYPGQTATIRAVDTDNEGRFIYIPQPSLGATGVVLALLWCLLPLIISLCIKLPEDEDDKDGPAEQWLLPLIIVTLSCIVLLSQLSSYAAFTASVKNEKSELRTYPLLGCGEGAATMNPRPLFTYGLAEHSGATEADISGNGRDGRFLGPPPSYDWHPRLQGCAEHIDLPAHFKGSTCLISNQRRAEAAPGRFSVEVWLSTTRRPNGKIIGFGSDGNSTGGAQYDRHLYIDKDGRIVFGVWNRRANIVKTPAGRNYADGQWHHVVATMSGNGLKLYVNGELADSAAVYNGQPITGHWKIGCGGGGSWPQADGTRPGVFVNYYNGRLQLPAVYGEELSPQKIRQRYRAGSQ